MKIFCRGLRKDVYKRQVMNYLFGRLLDSENERLRRMIVGLAVCVNLALLFVFKYLDMAVSYTHLVFQAVYKVP